ncbi:hypothetical protein BH11MYX3_BH11MYX3_38670 [soil metagenome]
MTMPIVALAMSAMAAGACVSEPPAEWHYVYATVIASNCTTSACHSSLSTAGAVDLHDDAAAYEALTGRRCDDATAPVGGYVDVIAPAQSFLSGLLRRTGPTGMPPNARLSTTEIERIEAWMSQGAPCD